MKKLISVLLIFVMIFSIFMVVPFNASAVCTDFAKVSYESGDYKFELLNDGTAKITGYTGPETVLTVPSVIDGYEVTSIGNYAFDECESLTVIIISDGVTNIGNSAFYACRSLKTIQLPDSVTSIGENAFCGCNSLKTIQIPDNVTSIGEGAFSETGITSIVIPDGVTSIKRGTFYTCKNLRSIQIPNSVTSIENVAFYGCVNLSSINLPDNITSIGGAAFWCCYSLSSIVIPKGVTSISEGTFEDCTSLTSVTIPSGVTSIDGYAFKNTGLTSITIPQGVISIGTNAFIGCTKLVEVVLPCSIESIEPYAFEPRLPVIYGYTGTVAESYAKENNHKFMPLDVPKSIVKKIEVMPIFIMEGTSGSFSTYYDLETKTEYEYFCYQPEDNLECKITWLDGSVTYSVGLGVEYSGEYYWFDISTGQCYFNQWEAGKTYTMKVTLDGVTVEVPVTIEERPIQEIVFEPIILIEKIQGDKDYDYNEETGENDLEYFRYSLKNDLVYNVTWKDGSVTEEKGNYIDYNDETYWLNIDTDQSYYSQWEPNNTYIARVNIMGISVEVPVAIKENPIESIKINPVTLTEYVDGYSVYDYNDDTGEFDLEYFRYLPEEKFEYTVAFKNGKVDTGSGIYGMDYASEYYVFSVETGQSYIDQWEGGNTYNIMVEFMGISLIVPVTIEKCAIKDVKLVKEPDRLNLEYGEVLDLRGAQLRFFYTDNTFEDIELKEPQALMIGQSWEVSISCLKDRVRVYPVYENGVYKIKILEYTVPTSITVNSDVLKEITIKNDGCDLLLTNHYSSGRSLTQKVVDMTSGYGSGELDYMMRGGILITDKGRYNAEYYKNFKTNEFYIKILLDRSVLVSNTLKGCPFFDLQTKLNRIADILQVVSTKQFNGEVTSENVDDLIRIAVESVVLIHDESALISVEHDKIVFKADSIKTAFCETFGLTLDLSLSSNCNTENNSYVVYRQGLGSSEYRVVNMKCIEDGFVAEIVWDITGVKQIVVFDENLCIKSYYVESSEMLGDVDCDGDITIMDATAIQLHIAQLEIIPEDKLACADTDGDGSVTIMDATQIQLFIAQLIPSL